MHTAFREALDPFLAPAALAPYRAEFERITAVLLRTLPRGARMEAVGEIGAAFAVRAQSAWLGWSPNLEGRLLAWIEDNHGATRSGEGTRTVQVAEEFDDIIRLVLVQRRSESIPSDVTGELLRVHVQGGPLRTPRSCRCCADWTGGDLGSIALCVGVLVHHLASRPELQSRLRESVPDAELDLVIDEVLRIDDPFVTNRRVTTAPVDLGGVWLPVGARVKLHWTSANRDERVFGGPDTFDPAGHGADNLVHGIGRHACPGRPLATLELRIAAQALLTGTTAITLDPTGQPSGRWAPVGGWAGVPVLLD
jgi:cytochrome P450